MGENFKTLCEGAYYEDAEGRTYGPVTLGESFYPYEAKDRQGNIRFFNKTGKHYLHRSMDLVRVLPDKDGWYPHIPDDPQPVGDDVVVECELRCGYRDTVEAIFLKWGTLHVKDEQIVKYRIIPEQKSPQASGPGDQAQPAVMSIHDTPADAPSGGTFKRGDLVKKRGKKGQWHGVICGEYSTSVTPEGYCVRSLLETDSVQIYPVEAIEPWDGIFTLRFEGRIEG